MSDAIVLDVLSASPVQLDVGDADPIAREEIAELAERMDAAEGDISTLGTTVDGIDARVEAIEADYVTAEDVMGALGGEAPTLVAGSSRAVLGDAETASWMQRTTATDGAALVEAIYGNTIVQNDSLLPVRMEGIETVGFNQWDEEWEKGTISPTGGGNTSSETGIRSKNLIPVFPSTEYNISIYGKAANWILVEYDSNGNYLRYNLWGGSVQNKRTFVTSADAHYIRFCTNSVVASGTTYGTTYNHDICINISDPARNGTYEPYWRSERAIPASTYFPGGMRSAGSVRDELRADAAVTRVGERAYQSGDESDASVVTDGTVTHYALATPTTQPINPLLPMSYRTGKGGTERVMVASGTQSAPPMFATRYPLDPADLAASIAPRESVVATTNHQIGDLIMLGWTLCKATQVIVTGETIEIGTNVTRTSVAAELAALSE